MAVWSYISPQPIGPKSYGDDENNELLKPKRGEALCCLVGDWRIFQNVAGHRWSTDDIVTAWFAGRVVKPSVPSRCLDIG